jgi:excisionase family DNA binding protein
VTDQPVKQKSASVERTLLRPREVVQSTGLSRVTVYNLISTGELASVRVGRAIRVPVEALKRWIENKANVGEHHSER